MKIIFNTDKELYDAIIDAFLKYHIDEEKVTKLYNYCNQNNKINIYQKAHKDYYD